MEIKIGVQHSPREIVLDVDKTADQISKTLTEALTNGDTIVLDDAKGRRLLIPADKLAYIEIGEPSSRHVGFGTG